MAKEIIWSEYQKAIFDAVQNGTGNFVVIARAGSAKTSSLVESIKYIPNKKAKVLCIAFNKSIAVELEERINKSYVEVRTLHSLGFSVIKKHFGKVAIDPNKSVSIIKGTFPPDYKCWEEIFLIDKAVSLCKGSMVDSPSKIDELMDNFDIEPVDLEREDFIKRVVRCLRLCKEKKDSVNFDDMIYLPVAYGMQFPRYDYVFIDEQQDLNLAQQHIALSCSTKDGRVFAFADDFQAIYSWRGADENAVPNIIKRLNAKTLPLPISYRCGKAIIKMAQEYVPDIQHAPSAIEGSIKYITEDDLINKAVPGDFVISRTNAPLIKHAMNFIKHKIPANIQGRDIGANLKSIIKKSKKSDINSFNKWLDKWRDDEVRRLTVKRRNTDGVLDKYECIQNLLEGAKSVSDLEKNIDDLFSDKDGHNIVLFLSCHKSKGLERKNVFMIRRTFRPGSSQEETNLMYVCITRSIESLTIVNKV